MFNKSFLMFFIIGFSLMATNIQALSISAGMNRFFGKPKDFHREAVSITTYNGRTINESGDARGQQHEIDFFEGTNFTAEVICILPGDASNEVIVVSQITQVSPAGNSPGAGNFDPQVGDYNVRILRDDDVNGDQISSSLLGEDLVFNSCATFTSDNDLSQLVFGGADRYLGQVKIKP